MEERNELWEDLISLETEREVLEKGLEALNVAVEKGLYIEPETLNELKVLFFTDDEDLVFNPELEKTVQNLTQKYSHILGSDDENFYLALTNLLEILGETPEKFFPKNLKTLKLIAENKLISVQKEIDRLRAKLNRS